jgi:hypothetical protein
MTAALESLESAPKCLSPFPPFADYAFRSNCHTGALVGGRTHYRRRAVEGVHVNTTPTSSEHRRNERGSENQ